MSMAKRVMKQIDEVVESFEGRTFTTYDVYDRMHKGHLTPSVQQISAYLRRVAVSVDSGDCDTYYNGNKKTQTTKVNKWCAMKVVSSR